MKLCYVFTSLFFLRIIFCSLDACETFIVGEVTNCDVFHCVWTVPKMFYKERAKWIGTTSLIFIMSLVLVCGGVMIYLKVKKLKVDLLFSNIM